MSERPRLEAVVFDAGGTLGRLDFEWMAEAVTGLGVPLDAARLRRAEIEGRRRYDASVGPPPRPGDPHPPLGSTGDIRAYLGGMLEAAGVRGPAREAAIESFLARQKGPGLWARPMEGARAAIDGIGALGLRRAVVSNSDGRAEWHLGRWNLLEGIEFVVDSQLVGIEKPDPRIFAIALDRLGIPAGRALYVGDIRSVDEAGSRAAGMHFVLLDPYGDYADGSVAIAGIAELPAWVAAHFSVPAGALEAPRAARREP
ncbi:MAG TPA: HAD family hydrolase [Candidatus Eisenbacteria bacterium]